MDANRSTGQDKVGLTLRQPCGVAVAITPFNYPSLPVLHKLAPALAAGNAVVLKPAPASHAPAGMNDPQFVVFETELGALTDVETFGHCGYDYQVHADGRWGGRITPDYVERFEDARDREVQAWADATRRGGITDPSVWDIPF